MINQAQIPWGEQADLDCRPASERKQNSQVPILSQLEHRRNLCVVWQGVLGEKTKLQ